MIDQIIDGRYRIIKLIAPGGMANVFQALDMRLDRIVALKIMHEHLAADIEFRKKFEREAKSTAKLSHPHVVAVYDQGTGLVVKTNQEVTYLAMEYLPGRTLRDILRKFAPLTPEQSLVILEPVLDALIAAHAAGFIHRDIKPENVILADDGRVKVADFGLARALEAASNNATGLVIGTPAYLAPEQIELAASDERSDIYAAGIMLYEMVTGSVPHSGETPLATALKHVNEPIPSPSISNNKIPREIDELVAKATARNPDNRFSSAQEFIKQVHRIQRVLPMAKPLGNARAQFETHVLEKNINGAWQESNDEQLTTLLSNVPELENDGHSIFRKRKSILVASISALAVILVLSGWKTADFLTSAKVPNLVGLTITQAQKELAIGDIATEEIKLVEDAGEFNDEIARGIIVKTNPNPGDSLGENAVIEVTISLGPKKYAIPDVSSKDQGVALAELTSIGFKVDSTVRVFNTLVPEGQAVGTKPIAGTQLTLAEPLTLEISKGPQPVTIPNLRGNQFEEVKKKLERLGLIPVVTEQYNEIRKVGSVIRSKPAAGEIVPAGSEISLLVSKGPPPVEVPNLIDKRRRDAVAALEALGFKVSVQAGAVTPLNRVLNQSPTPGTLLPKGSVVTIRII